MKKEAKQLTVKIDQVKKVRNDIFLLSFRSAYIAQTAKPGNFLHLKVNTTILRRPLSIHRVKDDLIYILFKQRGRGTKALAEKKKNDQLDLIGPLGNGFKVKRRENSILVAGGIGVAPLLFLAQKLAKRPMSKVPASPAGGQRSTPDNIILMGAKDKKELVCEEEFKKLGFQVKIASEDGSKGYKGFVTDLLKKRLRTSDFGLRANIYACGPKDMFDQINKILKNYKNINTQLSFEQFMGCGLGVCSACVIPTKTGYKKVCQDGPVFNLKEIY
ncbi:MAG: dihydroorotate dehydrogenase electron transfer subunit [Candidatus Omnitrophica bacterium]|nr:dihydroorotate dehydrogenase electron transfer subunit [Candidatus Omnitrophota bacterium]MCF7893689.1 dihydroorotate dehydrogenase electron transfer subunit [Candidatus Omnitrophota bacterium]